MYPIADILILLFLSISILIGVYRGFVREFFTFSIWTIPAILVLLFWQSLANQLQTSIDLAQISSWVESESILRWAAVILIYLSTYGVLSLLRMLVTHFLFSRPGGGDRLLGMLFGAARGVALVVVAVVVGQHLSLSEESWWTESYLIPSAEAVSEEAQDHLPSQWEELLVDVRVQGQDLFS